MTNAEWKKRIEGQMAELQGLLDHADGIIKRQREVMGAAMLDNAQLREALGVYAKEENWNFDGDRFILTGNGWDLAVRALGLDPTSCQTSEKPFTK